MSVYDYRDRPAYNNDDWPPYSNRNISKWWTAEHDELLGRLIDQWQWNWYWEVADAVVSITPKEEIAPFLATGAWYNKVMKYAITRAKSLELDERVRKPQWKVCPLCQERFVEDSLPQPLVQRFGIDGLDFCAPCLRDTVLQGTGDDAASREKVLTYLRDLTNILQRIPPQGFGEDLNDFRDLDFNQRLAVLQKLQGKPTVRRVKELFGSWLQALIESGILDEDARRTSRGVQCLAKDGHICLSLGEKTIDDYLHTHGILHEKEPTYPEGNYRADFTVNGIFIEYFGLQGDPEYDKRAKEKQRICKQHNMALISIFPKDLVSIAKLSSKLRQVLPDDGQRDHAG
jgi:hypothetical protein